MRLPFLPVSLFATALVGGVAVCAQDQGVPAALSAVESGPHPLQIRANPKDGQRYVWIPPGSFVMGCSEGDSECLGDEKPAHQVTLTKGFWIGQTAVTVDAWKRYRAATRIPALPTTDDLGRKLNEAAGDGELPVVLVTWNEARDFCDWAGARLLTEGEWEYAARAGSSTSRYGDVDAIAWDADNSGRKRIDSAQIWRTDRKNYAKRLFENGNRPHPVGRRQQNAWGLYDMLGNVWQWTVDWYDDAAYYGSVQNRDPLGPAGGQFRVLRGGSWYDSALRARASSRGAYGPAFRHYAIGLRCAAETGAF